jgi:FKBP-type peptidyl-prolyl cis-trans isomerase SlyD
MVIDNNKVVSLTYELRVNDENGQVLETVNNDKPLTFLYGSGKLLPRFEENLSGLKAGDKFNFQLTSDEAYGSVDENAIVDVPIDSFVIDGKLDESLLTLGNTIPMQDGAGNRLNGVVKQVTDQAVTMDFNHPLAGENLYFNGSVSELRDATPEEIEGGLNSCGSGCGCGSGEKHEHAHHEHGGGGCGC